MSIVSRALDNGIARWLRSRAAAHTIDRLAASETEDEFSALRAELEASDRAPDQRPRRRLPPSTIAPLAGTAAMLDDVLARAVPRVRIRGTADDVSLDVLLRLVETDALSGRLWIRTATELLTFDVRAGRIYRACSHGPLVPGERLGDILVEMGLVTASEVEEEVERSTASGRPIGVGLVASGRVRVDELKEALRRQSVARFSRALEARSAAYAFGDKPPE